MPRFLELDFLRGIAIIMMVIFHSLFYIDYFGFYDIELYSGFIGRFQMIIPVLFISVSGISSRFNAHFNGKKKALKRGIEILLFALAITLATFAFFPKDFVFFGILHLIGLSMVLSLGLNDFFAAMLGGILLLSKSFADSIIIGSKWLSVFGFNYPALQTFDYYPIIPWMGLFFISYFFGRYFLNTNPRRHESRIFLFISKIGKHSLKIYFLHIIILYCLFFGLRMVV